MRNLPIETFIIAGQQDLWRRAILTFPMSHTELTTILLTSINTVLASVINLFKRKM
jgi:hypothetical protein